MKRFNYHPTDSFTSKLDKIREQDPPGHVRILRVIDRMLSTPGDADGKMHGLYNGRLKKYVGRREYDEESRKSAGRDADENQPLTPSVLGAVGQSRGD